MEKAGIRQHSKISEAAVEASEMPRAGLRIVPDSNHDGNFVNP